MLKTFAVILFATAVSFATALSIGAAQARMSGMSSRTHAHFPTCADGLVKANCVCRAEGRANVHQLCPSGRYCHTYDGACRQ
jgi:hypothetical protein